VTTPSAVADAPTRARLADWLSACLHEQVSPDALHLTTPSAGGWSNDTWIVSTGSARTPRVVARIQPDRSSMFPRYDLERQVRCLHALGRQPDVPTPALLDTDLEGTWLGRPAFVMAHVAGRLPSDDTPTFAEAGWLVEATRTEQRRFHTSLIDAMAAVHQVDLDTTGLRSLRPSHAGSSNEAALGDLREIWQYDRGERWPTAIEDGFAAAEAHIPSPGADRLLWGDARPANVVVADDGFDVVALLDWELATVGSPEHDVTWLMEMNWIRLQGAGNEPLPGFLSDADTVGYYEQRTGRPLANLGWYRYVAALRVAVLMHRYLRAMVHAGRLPADHKLLADTVASRRLTSMTAARYWDHEPTEER